MALFSDYYDRATKARKEEIVGPTLSAKAQNAALVAEQYFAKKMELLPEDVRPKHPVMTPKDAAPYVRHFVTTDLVEHLDNGPMKRAVAAAVRNTPTLATKIEETRQLAREEEIDAIGEARKVLPGKLAKSHEGTLVKKDERKVLVELLKRPDVVQQHHPLIRMYRRDPSILKEHFASVAKQQKPAMVAKQMVATRRADLDAGQEFAA